MSAARWMPPPLFRALGTLAGSVGWLVAARRRRTIRKNLAHLTAGNGTASRHHGSAKVFRQLFEDASDLFRLPALSRTAILDLVETKGLDELRRAQASGRGVIVVTPHLGPYELGGAVLALLGFAVHGLVEDIDPDTNAALAAYRAATGLQLLSRNTGLRQLYRLLTQGSIVLLVADRMVGGGEGLVVPFGDAAREVPTGPAAFALATGAPIVPGYIVRGPRGAPRYVLHVDPAIEPDGHTKESLTRLVASRLETFIRAHPDQWYVFQPDWRARDGRP